MALVVSGCPREGKVTVGPNTEPFGVRGRDANYGMHEQDDGRNERTEATLHNPCCDRTSDACYPSGGLRAIILPVGSYA